MEGMTKKEFAGCMIAFLVCVWILTWMALGGANAEFYPRVAVVDNVDRETDIVVFVDSVGFAWEWEGAEDWEVGDTAALLMDDADTEIIFDDIIVKAHYSSFVIEQ